MSRVGDAGYKLLVIALTVVVWVGLLWLVGAFLSGRMPLYPE